MGKPVKQLYLIGDEETARFFSLQIPAKRFGPVKEARTSFLSFQFGPIDDLTASRFLVCYDEITERAQGKSIVVMSNWDSQCIDTGFIATGKHQRGNNYFTTNEVEDDFLNTQGENSPISTQPNLNFPQEPSPIHLSISASRREEKQPLCASTEKKSDRTAIHNEEFSVSAAVKTVQQLQGFSTGDIAFAITMFIDNARVCEAFLSCNEETRAPLIKAMIDQHKAKEKRPREELEQDANQNQTQSKLRRISSMKIGRKRQWEELDQDANQNQPQSKLVRMISSMKNQPQSCQMRVGMIRIFKARSALRFAFIMIGISKGQYDIEEAVPTLRTQRLHIEELPTHKLVFANQVTQPLYTCKNITDKNKMPIEIQLIDINTGRQCTNVEGTLKVKIVVIDGDLELEGLDSDKFNSNIVKQREGKRPLLIGNTEVTFNQQGVGTIGKICFTDNSKWLRSRKFRLGACIDSKSCGTTIKIQEGLSEKFEVKDQRGLLYEKHYPPMLNLNDDVWRLENIAKDGKYHQRLKDKDIYSVQDFLKFWNENPSGLNEEILKMPTNAYNNVVKHAQMCPMELDNSNFENNADLPKSPGLESFPLPNPMPEFPPENMEPGMIEMNGELSAGHAKTFASGQDTNVLNSGVISRNYPLLNVPVPNAGMLHTPESQTQCWFTSVGMELGMIEMNGVLSAGHAKSFALGQDTNVLNSGVISRNDPLLNVPVPNAGMLHTPESQTQCWFTSVGMEQGMIEMNGESSDGHAKTFALGQDTNVLNSGVISINDPLLNVPVPNAGMLHALESQAQCWYTSVGMDMGQQMDTAACFGSDHSNPISSVNGNNGSLEGAPEVGQAYLPYPAHITQEVPEDCNTLFPYEELAQLLMLSPRANDHESGGSHSLDYMDVAEESLLGMPTHPDC